MAKITAAITGVGQYLPDYILTNEELSKMVDTSDEWIMSHIGVKTRHILKGEGVGTSYMGARAIINLLDKTGVDPMDIDLVICATVTPDMFFPSTGNLIADQAGCKNAFAYDVSAACSGFLFALTTGAKFIEAGSCKKVVVVGATRCRRLSTIRTARPARFSVTVRVPCCSSPIRRGWASSTRFSTRTARASCSST